VPRPDLHTGTIVSIGYEGRSLDEFVQALKGHRVDVLIDVRLTPISRKKGFSKTALSEALWSSPGLTDSWGVGDHAAFAVS